MHLTYLAILLPTLGTALAPDAGVGGSDQSQLVAYLDAHDVPTLAELRALAPAPEALLMAIANDARVDGLGRSRAVAALRLVPTPEVQAFLGKLVQSNAKATDATDRLIVRRAAVALGWTLAPNAPARLALLFDNDDADVRLDAVIGLGLTRAAEAAGILRSQLAVETVARVRDQIERQLRVLAQIPSEQEKPPARPSKQPMRSAF